MIKTIKNNLGFILLLILCLSVRVTGVFTVNLVQGNSMDTTLHNNQLLIGSSLYKINDNIRYGDVITVKHDGVQIIKRVIAKEGDTVEIKDDVVYRNGEKLNEEYVSTESPDNVKNIGPITLKDNEYFILGDNRSVSLDSRYIGPVTKDMIVSKIIGKY